MVAGIDSYGENRSCEIRLVSVLNYTQHFYYLLITSFFKVSLECLCGHLKTARKKPVEVNMANSCRSNEQLTELDLVKIIQAALQLLKGHTLGILIYLCV